MGANIVAGSVLRRRRQVAGLSLDQMISDTDLPLRRGSLHRLETGARDVTVEDVVLVAQALKVPVADLFAEIALLVGGA